MNTFLVKYVSIDSDMPRYKALTIDTALTLTNQQRHAEANSAIHKLLVEAINSAYGIYTVLAIGNFSFNDKMDGIGGYAMMTIDSVEKQTVTTAIVREPSNRWETE